MSSCVENASADPLTQRLDAALAECPHVRAGDVVCLADQDRVLLQGHVPSYFAKQMVQETLRRLDGVQQIDNQLEVHWM